MTGLPDHARSIAVPPVVPTCDHLYSAPPAGGRESSVGAFPGCPMQGWLRLSGWIDALNERVGRIATWMVLLSCLISAGNATTRYAFNMSSNAWLEVQWYM